MTLRDTILADVTTFINTDDFGETVSYTPNGGAARDIDIVFFDGSLNVDPYIEQAEYKKPSMLAKATDMTDLTHKATILRSSITYLCTQPDINMVQTMPFIKVELVPQ